MEIRRNFAKNLLLMLKERNLKQKDFAKLVGVGETCVSKWLLMKTEPTLSNIDKILKALNCTYDELVG